MNARIRELAEQAEKLADEHTKAFTDGTGEWKRSWNEVYDEKFAELIVRECAEVAQMNTPDTEECEYTHLISEKIREYFGVQE
jgi:hypothetical protein